MMDTTSLPAAPPSSVNDLLSRPADEFENDQALEALWAIKAAEHAEVYFNPGSASKNYAYGKYLVARSWDYLNHEILCAVDPKILKLTPHDHVIYTSFRNEFPDLKVDIVNENELKSPEQKEKWRPFCETFKELVEDYSFGTLLRTDCTEGYSEANSILVPRIQFLAIELARNREGLNDAVRTKFKSNK